MLCAGFSNQVRPGTSRLMSSRPWPPYAKRPNDVSPGLFRSSGRRAAPAAPVGCRSPSSALGLHRRPPDQPAYAGARRAGWPRRIQTEVGNKAGPGDRHLGLTLDAARDAGQRGARPIGRFTAAGCRRARHRGNPADWLRLDRAGQRPEGWVPDPAYASGFGHPNCDGTRLELFTATRLRPGAASTTSTGGGGGSDGACRTR